MNFIEAMKIAEGVLAKYKIDQLKWWKRLDGTPMLNDLAVLFSLAFMEAATEKQDSAKRCKVGSVCTTETCRCALICDEPNVCASKASAQADVAAVRDAQLDGSRPLPFTRDELGLMVRQAWVKWAETQPSPKPSWLVPYAELSEADKEADRQIGETVARLTLIMDAGNHAVFSKSAAPTEQHPDDLAVDQFASAMKAKLAKKRGEGYGGWNDKDDCSQGFLTEQLIKHTEKGDPVDVGNFAMMLHQRGERLSKVKYHGQQRVVAGALFDLMGRLTTRETPITLSSRHEASPAVEAIREFAEARGLKIDDAIVADWQYHVGIDPAPTAQLQADGVVK